MMSMRIKLLVLRNLEMAEKSLNLDMMRPSRSLFNSFYDFRLKAIDEIRKA